MTGAKERNLYKRLKDIDWKSKPKRLVLDNGSIVYGFSWGKDRFEYHRLDGPAIEELDSTKFWYRNGKAHREDGPWYVDANGTMEWRLDGVLHREDGPAIEIPELVVAWYRNGKLHREDGPALISPDGTEEWFLNGKQITMKEALG
jgi:hypothetical protein